MTTASSNGEYGWPVKRSYHIAYFIGCLLFLSMMCMPRVYSEYKIPFVLLLVYLIAIQIIWSRKLNLHPHVFIWFAVFLSHGLVWALIGLLNGNPGVIDQFRLSVVWTILYGLFISAASGRNYVNTLVKMIIWAGVLISFYNIAFILKTIGVIPDIFLFHLEMGAKIGIHTGYIQLTAHNIGTLAFIAPFLFSLLVFTDEDKIFGHNRRTVLMVLLITVATVILSGRRVLWINIMVAPLICYGLSAFMKKKNRTLNKKLFQMTVSMLMIGMLLFTYFSIFTEWSPEEFVNRVSGLLDEEERVLQINALIKGFIENPVLGSGFGLGVPEVIRNEESPWVYEMSYHIMLFNVGIIGMAIYLGCIGWIYAAGLKLADRHPAERAILLSLLVGMTNFLLANATNPYFGSYDFMWTLFLPVAYVNWMMLRRGDTDG